MKELLLQLCAPAGVSGAEKPAAQEAAEALSAFAQVHTDASGNVIGEIAGHGPHILLDAHIDQVGMVVTGVDAEGFLRIDKCGGIDIRTLAGHEVTVWGREPLYGVVCSTPPHLSKQEDQSITDITDMAIDIGLSAEAAREKVHPGDRVTLRRSPKSCWAGRSALRLWMTARAWQRFALPCPAPGAKGGLPLDRCVFYTGGSRRRERGLRLLCGQG